VSLTIKQETAALLIASGMKMKDVAAKVNVSPATISNWRRLAGFIAEVNRNKQSMLDASRDKLCLLVTAAMEVMERLLECDNDNVRLQACKLIFSANGLIGDGERSMIRYGLGIGPTTEIGVRIESEKKEEIESSGYFF